MLGGKISSCFLALSGDINMVRKSGYEQVTVGHTWVGGHVYEPGERLCITHSLHSVIGRPGDCVGHTYVSEQAGGHGKGHWTA